MDEIGVLLAAIAAILSATVWPAVVVVLFVRFSGDVSRIATAIADRIQAAEVLKLAHGKTSAEISGFLAESAADARELILLQHPQASDEIVLLPIEAELVSDYKRADPAAAIATWRSVLTSRVASLVREAGEGTESPRNLRDGARLLRESGRIDADLEQSISQFESLADLARGSEGLTPDQRASNALGSLAEAILGALPNEL